MKWNVYGKMQHIYKHSATYGTASNGLHYYYDPSGNRTGMAVLYNPSSYNEYTWYVRDAQGNVMAVYKANGANLATITLKLREHYIYGSSRLGVINRNMDVDQPRLTPDKGNANLGTAYLATFTRGDKLFEFTNHLGNVLFTATDGKVPKAQTGNPSLVGSYSVNMVTAIDYTPFGMIMQGMNYGSAAPGKYRYGFNGKEWDNSTKGNADQIDYGERMYDNRAGRFLSVDPLTKQYPFYTPYSYAGNKPIWANDIDGLEDITFQAVWEGKGSMVDLINNPNFWNDLYSSALNTVSNFNPAWLGYVRGYEYTTGSDYYTGYEKSRLSTTIEAGGDIMMSLTMGRLLKVPNARTSLEIEMAQNAKAGGVVEPTPTQAPTTGASYDMATQKAIFRNAKGIKNRGNALEQFGTFPGNRYAEMEWVGKLDKGFFPTVDYLGNKIGIQLKSFDGTSLNVNQIKKAIDKLANVVQDGHVTGKTQSFMVNAGELDILMPEKYFNKEVYKSLWKKIDDIVKYGDSKNIPVNPIKHLKTKR